MSRSGALTFARYAFPPNDLGYCGPEGARAMLAPGAVEEIGRRARRFEGAWVYLSMIAEVFGDDDPLSQEVVEAYWIGSDRLHEVPSADLVSRLEARFVGQVGGTWRTSSTRAIAHHSFQVFEVYPWAAMLAAGATPGPAVRVLDRCRVRTGVVTAVHGEWVAVTSQILRWEGGRLLSAPHAPETARWSVDGLSLMSAPSVGDVVALHWDWVCDVLTETQASRIESMERSRLQALGLC